MKSLLLSLMPWLAAYFLNNTIREYKDNRLGLFRKKSSPPDKPVAAKQQPALASASDRLINHALAKGAIVQDDDRTAFLGNVLVSIQLHGKETRDARQARYRAAMTALEPLTDWRLPLGPGLWLLGAARGHIAIYEALAGSLDPQGSSFTVMDLTAGQGYSWDGRSNRAVEVAPTSFEGDSHIASATQGRLPLSPETNPVAEDQPEVSASNEKPVTFSEPHEATPNVSVAAETSSISENTTEAAETQPSVGNWPGAERFALIGIADEGELANVIQQAPEKGRKLAGLAATLPGETTPRSLIAYANPDGRVQVTSLFSFDREANMLDFMTSFPSSEDGLRYNLTSTEVAVSASGLEAEISATNESGSAIKFFDTRFFAHQRRYRIGQAQPFILLAFACQIDVVRSAIKAKSTAKDSRNIPAPCNWKASGRVKTVSRYLTLGRAFTRLLVAFKSDSDRDFDLIVHATDGVIKGAEPQVGDLIEAQLWVQGFLIATQSDLAVD